MLVTRRSPILYTIYSILTHLYDVPSSSGAHILLGQSPWETVLGHVTPDTMSVLERIYVGYGDIPPWGNGPDQTILAQQGNAYIKENFPLIDFITECHLDADDASCAVLDKYKDCSFWAMPGQFSKEVIMPRTSSHCIPCAFTSCSLNGTPYSYMVLSAHPMVLRTHPMVLRTHPMVLPSHTILT